MCGAAQWASERVGGSDAIDCVRRAVPPCAVRYHAQYKHPPGLKLSTYSSTSISILHSAATRPTRRAASRSAAKGASRSARTLLPACRQAGSRRRKQRSGSETTREGRSRQAGRRAGRAGRQGTSGCRSGTVAQAAARAGRRRQSSAGQQAGQQASHHIQPAAAATLAPSK